MSGTRDLALGLVLLFLSVVYIPLELWVRGYPEMTVTVVSLALFTAFAVALCALALMLISSVEERNVEARETGDYDQ